MEGSEERGDDLLEPPDDLRGWFEVLINLGWAPELSPAFTVSAQATLKRSAPNWLYIQAIWVEVLTERDARPVRVYVNTRVGMTEANCQFRNENYTVQAPPGKGRATLSVVLPSGKQLDWVEGFDLT